MNLRIHRYTRAALAVLGALLVTGALAQTPPSAPPPEPYVSVSELLPLPEFIPGAGALYIDPANAPVGPYLAYGNDGSLVEVLYMVPLSGMNAAQNWQGLSADVLEQFGINHIDHVDITFNGGHPGMAEPHYHIRLVLVDEAAQQAALSQ